jgi:iron complex outermembrane receptor protein
VAAQAQASQSNAEATAAAEATLQSEPSAAGKPTELARVVVTANPLGNKEVVAPTSVLQGKELFVSRGTTLGETVAGLPGVSASQFGPNSSRPIIRGLDGDRVRMLSNGGASFDASSLSFDHAVPIDPLLIDRVEVVRGPAALIYGGNAVGGVVNAIDNRIPMERVTGLSGSAEVRLGGANAEQGAALRLDGGEGDWAFHVDGFSRETDNLRTPSFTPVADGEALDATDEVFNSASRTQGGSVGAAYFFGKARLGVSADTYDSRYGVVVEPDVEIKMKRQHLGAAFDWTSDTGWVRGVKALINQTDYQHEEVNGEGEVGTVFKTDGTEARLELEHQPLGSFKGLVGLDVEQLDFSALGDEAFVPTTRTSRQGLFLLEQTPWSGGEASLGVRLEKVKVNSDGDAPDATEPRFGDPAQRDFSLRSLSISNLMKLSPTWSLSTAWSHSERAPTSFELFANGVHVATAAVEVGDPTLPSERGQNLDVALQWREGERSVRLGVFQSNFSRFISMDATGEYQDVELDGETVSYPVYHFNLVKARLRGFELETKIPLPGAPWGMALSNKLHLTQGRNLDSGQALPRIAPLRAHIGLDFHHGDWAGHVDLERAQRQPDVPADDVATPGYTLLNVSVNRQFEFAGQDGLWFVKLGNLTNALAYNASSIQTVRQLSPLAGRSIKAGVRVAF